VMEITLHCGGVRFNQEREPVGKDTSKIDTTDYFAEFTVS